jgi:hypothetical protein
LNPSSKTAVGIAVTKDIPDKYTKKVFVDGDKSLKAIGEYAL